MRTRENSVVISVRVERDIYREFLALSEELGEQSARNLLEAFMTKVIEMRDEANKKRVLYAREPWEVEWKQRNA
jgi:hypothetical protein